MFDRFASQRVLCTGGAFCIFAWAICLAALQLVLPVLRLCSRCFCIVVVDSHYALFANVVFLHLILHYFACRVKHTWPVPT